MTLETFTLYSTTGEIKLTCINNDKERMLELNPGLLAIDGEFYTDTHYIENNQVLEKPTQPSIYHVFSYETKDWVISEEAIAEAKRQKITEINSVLERKKIEPIEVSEGLFDANDTAIKNIQGKIQEIALKENLGLSVDFLIWRSADNINVEFESLESYKDFLSRLVIAISARTTSLYQMAWIKKAEVDGLSTIEDILAYEIGW